MVKSGTGSYKQGFHFSTHKVAGILNIRFEGSGAAISGRSRLSGAG
jgi:hypothetical protein